jgi:hypothetical protein
MRTSTKLRKLLDKHVVAFSYGEDGWSITLIKNDNPSNRQNFIGHGNFSQVVHAAFASMYNRRSNRIDTAQRSVATEAQ